MGGNFFGKKFPPKPPFKKLARKPLRGFLGLGLLSC